MANTPEGTPYVESSDLVANYPAASLALANRVDLVGVLPFANAAARTTAISSPTDGQYSYLQNTNATEFWNGSAWVAAATAPGLVHINTTTFTAASSVSINNVFTTTYDSYLIQYDVILASAGSPQGLNLYLRVSGVNTTTNYESQVWAVSNGGSGQVTGVVGRTATSGGGGVISILRPFLAQKTTAVTQSMSLAAGVDMYTTMGGLFHNANTSFDGFSLIVAAGTIAGTIRVFGFKKS